MLEPLEVAIINMTNKIGDLKNVLSKEPCDPKLLQMQLQGGIATSVNQVSCLLSLSLSLFLSPYSLSLLSFSVSLSLFLTPSLLPSLLLSSLLSFSLPPSLLSPSLSLSLSLSLSSPLSLCLCILSPLSFFITLCFL